MRFVRLAASIAILSGTFAFAASAATTEQAANLGSCAAIQGQVKTALASNAQSPNYETAVKEQHYGLEFCANGFYKNGVTHYAEALRLLGAQQS